MCGSLSFIFTHPPEDEKNKKQRTMTAQGEKSPLKMVDVSQKRTYFSRNRNTILVL